MVEITRKDDIGNVINNFNVKDDDTLTMLCREYGFMNIVSSNEEGTEFVMDDINIGVYCMDEDDEPMMEHLIDVLPTKVRHSKTLTLANITYSGDRVSPESLNSRQPKSCDKLTLDNIGVELRDYYIPLVNDTISIENWDNGNQCEIDMVVGMYVDNNKMENLEINLENYGEGINVNLHDIDVDTPLKHIKMNSECSLIGPVPSSLEDITIIDSEDGKTVVKVIKVSEGDTLG